MSLLRPAVEVRALDYASVWGSGGTPDLSDVSSAPSALRLIPLYSAVSGIADDVSIMPWRAFRASGAGWGERIPSPFLLDPAGDGLGFIPWMTQGVMSACLWGFAFGIVLRDQAERVIAVRWIHPARVQIDETGTQPVFTVDGTRITDYLYVPGPLLPGSIRGLSPVTLFRLQFGKSLQAQQFASDLFTRGIMPPGVLKNTARTLAPGQAEKVQERFEARQGSRRPFVTGNDWQWTPLEVPKDDAVFLDTIRAGATEIASIYRVTPEDVGGVSGAPLTYSTLEMNQQNRNRRALMPWVRRFEAALSNLGVAGPAGYVKANMDALVRTDLKARMEAHDIALRIGMETQDEGRALEDRPPLTPEQIAAWRAQYGADQSSTPEGRARAAAELVQTVYLGVGTVLTADEARVLATQAGADLSAPFTPTPKVASITTGGQL